MTHTLPPEELPKDVEKRFDKEFLEFEHCGDLDCEYAGDDKCFHASEMWMKTWIAQELTRAKEEAVRDCISISEMTDEEMEYLEEKYHFKITDPILEKL